MTTESELEFTREIWLVARVPTVTEPNAIVAGDAVKPALEDPVDELFGASPPQPERAMQPLRTTDAKRKDESRFMGSCRRKLDERQLIRLLVRTE